MSKKSEKYKHKDIDVIQVKSKIRSKIKQKFNKNQYKVIQEQQQQSSKDLQTQSHNQVQIRKKHQIQQMENEIKKLDAKIELQRQLLRNRIISQQLEHQLKKNQIATKMSKKQIILKKLSLLKYQPTKDVKNQVKKKIKKQQNLSQIIHNQQKQQIRAKTQSLNKSQSKVQKLRSVWKKQKQYGDRVQKQYHSYRAKSAFSFIEHQRQHQVLISKRRAQQKKILQQLKKPSLPIQIDAEEGRKKQIYRIQSSNTSPEQKLKLLNYLSQAQLNRIKMKEIRGRYENMETLNCINKARTQIMLSFQ